jgi:OOP family OmpA-OmpF porin
MRTAPFASAAISLSLLLSLPGCELRREDAEPEPTPTASDTVGPSVQSEATASPPASIIRPDVTPLPVVETPPDPLAATIPFPDGGYELGAAAERLLAEVLESDQLAADWPIVLRGHTDSEGDDRGNLFASRKRAEAVAGWLVENGIDEDRIEVIAIGEQRPIAPNAHLDGTPDERGRARNRRVEVWIGPPGSEPDEEPRSEGEASESA